MSLDCKWLLMSGILIYLPIFLIANVSVRQNTVYPSSRLSKHWSWAENIHFGVTHIHPWKTCWDFSKIQVPNCLKVWYIISGGWRNNQLTIFLNLRPNYPCYLKIKSINEKYSVLETHKKRNKPHKHQQQLPVCSMRVCKTWYWF